MQAICRSDTTSLHIRKAAAYVIVPNSSTKHWCLLRNIIMSISFNTPIKTLSSFGLSVGDIAALAGAGRAVGTWLRAKNTDQALLEIVDVENIIARTGLVDATALDARWAKRMVIFADGQLLPLQEGQAKEVLKKVKLDRFTWVMTLITSALMVSTSQSCLEHVVLEVLTERCRDSEGYEYLVRDLKRNIECWMSTARTRTISRAAEDKWIQLERRKVHLPGQIPDTDYRELCRFLLWLIGAGDGGKYDNVFRTASSDTLSLAAVLQHVGIDGLRSVQHNESMDDDGLLYVVFDATRIASEPAPEMPKRRGMRINLGQMEETMSIWPGSAERNNQRRDIFLSAASSTGRIAITIGQWLIESRMTTMNNMKLQPIFTFAYGMSGRLQANVYQFAMMFFLAPDQATLDAFQRLIATWNQPESKTAAELIGVMNDKPNEISPSHFSDVQTFTLGYYYGLLRSIIDIRQMTVQEAFGSWTWNDWELFNLLRSGATVDLGALGLAKDEANSDATQIGSVPTGASPHRNRLRFWERHFVMKLAAYLFAGSEIKQVRSIERGACGVKGKLTLVDAALLGDADHWSRVRDFVLLDVDDTVFPSNTVGVINCGRQNINMGNLTQLQRPLNYVPLEEIVLAKGTLDFTSLVEPQWDEDMNACMLTYRRAGRLVHTIHPDIVYHAVLGASQLSPEVECHSEMVRFVTETLAIEGMNILDEKDENQCQIESRVSPVQSDSSPWDSVAQLSIEYFDGGKIPVMWQSQDSSTHRLCIATNNLRKVRSCLVSVCNIPFTFNTLAFPCKRERNVPAAMTRGLVVDLDCGQILIK